MAVTKCANLVPKAVCGTPASFIAFSRRVEDSVRHLNELPNHPCISNHTRSVFLVAPPRPVILGRIGCRFSTMRSCIPQAVPEQSSFHSPFRAGLHGCCMRHAKDG